MTEESVYARKMWLLMLTASEPVPLSTIEDERHTDEAGYLILSSRQPSVEETVIKKDLCEKLSEEAKTVINIIMEASSSEVMEVLNKKGTAVSIVQLRDYLKEKFHWRHKKIDSIFNELKFFVSSF